MYYINYYHYIILYQLYQLMHSNWNNWYNPHNWYNTMNMLPTTTSILQCAFNPIGFHYILQDQPKAHKLTNHILHRPRNPPGDLRARSQKDCVCCAEWFLCHRQELLAVFPGHFQLGWCKELVSCSLARIGSGNRQIPASLKRIYEYNTTIKHVYVVWLK